MRKRGIFIRSVLRHCFNVTALLCLTCASTTTFLAQFQIKRAESNCIKGLAHKFFSFSVDEDITVHKPTTGSLLITEIWQKARSDLVSSHSWIMYQVRDSLLSHEGHLKSSLILTWPLWRIKTQAYSWTHWPVRSLWGHCLQIQSRNLFFLEVRGIETLSRLVLCRK